MCQLDVDFPHPIRMTCECAWLAMEPVDTGLGRLRSTFQKGSVQVRIQAKIQSWFAPELVNRHPHAGNHSCTYVNPALEWIFTLHHHPYSGPLHNSFFFPLYLLFLLSFFCVKSSGPTLAHHSPRWKACTVSPLPPGIGTSHPTIGKAFHSVKRRGGPSGASSRDVPAVPGTAGSLLNTSTQHMAAWDRTEHC